MNPALVAPLPVVSPALNICCVEYVLTPETAFELLSAPPIATVKASVVSLADIVIPFPPTKSITPAAGLTVVPPEDIC